MANDPPTVPAVPVSAAEADAPALVPYPDVKTLDQRPRHVRKLAALDLQLRQQGAVIQELKAKLQHATERAEADERLIAEQATLLVRMSQDLKTAVEELRALVAEAAGEESR